MCGIIPIHPPSLHPSFFSLLPALSPGNTRTWMAKSPRVNSVLGILCFCKWSYKKYIQEYKQPDIIVSRFKINRVLNILLFNNIKKVSFKVCLKVDRDEIFINQTDHHNRIS